MARGATRGEMVEPRREHALEVGDIVLCRVNGSQFLHLVKAIQGERFQIGNNRGGINGWVTHRQIFAVTRSHVRFEHEPPPRSTRTRAHDTAFSTSSSSIDRAAKRARISFFVV